MGIITPTEEALEIFTIEQIAKKDVPAPYEYVIKWGVRIDEKGEKINIPEKYATYHTPYWIIKDENIPTDKAYRDAWTLSGNQGKPDGFGGENNEFDAELLNKYLWNIK